MAVVHVPQLAAAPAPSFSAVHLLCLASTSTNHQPPRTASQPGRRYLPALHWNIECACLDLAPEWALSSLFPRQRCSNVPVKRQLLCSSDSNRTLAANHPGHSNLIKPHLESVAAQSFVPALLLRPSSPSTRRRHSKSPSPSPSPTVTVTVTVAIYRSLHVLSLTNVPHSSCPLPYDDHEPIPRRHPLPSIEYSFPQYANTRAIVSFVRDDASPSSRTTSAIHTQITFAAPCRAATSSLLTTLVSLAPIRLRATTRISST